jgi:hypothetical protein
LGVKKPKKDSSSNDETINKANKLLPQHTKYLLSDVFQDLLNFSAKHLIEGGRLVFWLPIYLEERQNMRFNFCFCVFKINQFDQFLLFYL